MDEGQEEVQRFSLAGLEAESQALQSAVEGGVLPVTSPSTLSGGCRGKGAQEAQEPRGMVRMLLEHPVPRGEQWVTEEKPYPPARGQCQQKW